MVGTKRGRSQLKFKRTWKMEQCLQVEVLKRSNTKVHHSRDKTIVDLWPTQPGNVKTLLICSVSKRWKSEQLVEEMLTEGIVQPSTSPFQSPILLKKHIVW